MSMEPTISRTRFYSSLYLLIAGIYLLTASGRIGLSDGMAMLNVSRSIVEHGSLATDPCQSNRDDISAGASIGCVPGVDGRHYAGYGLIPSLAVAPVVFGASVIARSAKINPVLASQTAVSLFTVLVAPLACLTLAALLIRLGYSRRTAAIGAAILAFASPYWHFSVAGFFSEPYFTLALLAAVLAMSGGDKDWKFAIAGFSFGIACAIRLNGVILGPAFLIFIAVDTWQKGGKAFVREAAYFLGSLGFCLLLIAWANYARFGSPLKTGYHVAFPSASVLLASPFWYGLLKLLFHGQFGLLLFAPWVVVALMCFPRFAKAHAREAAFCATCFVIYVSFFAKFAVAQGGWVAGPRYLVPLLPLFVLVMAPALEWLQQAPERKQRRGAVLGLAMASLLGAAFLIQAFGAPFPDERYFSLLNFYEQRTVKPWWTDSIVLASIDFAGKMQLPGEPRLEKSRLNAKESEPAQIGEATAPRNPPRSEEEFLNQMPNPMNLSSPNLMAFKVRRMGFPKSLAWFYVAAAAAISGAGMFGLRRRLAS